MKRIILAVCTLFAVMSFQLFSQPEGKGYKKFIKELNLTEEQKKEADKIRLDMEKQMIEQDAKVKTARLELQELLKADKPDKSAIGKKVREIADLETQKKMIRIDAWFSMNSLLTPEQQKKWKKALEFGPAMKEHMMKKDIRGSMKKKGDWQ